MVTRTETDAFGPLEVENTRLWGAQTQRSLQNFPIGGPESKMPLQVRALLPLPGAGQPASQQRSQPAAAAEVLMVTLSHLEWHR